MRANWNIRMKKRTKTTTKIIAESHLFSKLNNKRRNKCQNAVETTEFNSKFTFCFQSIQSLCVVLETNAFNDAKYFCFDDDISLLLNFNRNLFYANIWHLLRDCTCCAYLFTSLCHFAEQKTPPGVDSTVAGVTPMQIATEFSLKCCFVIFFLLFLYFSFCVSFTVFV